MIGQQASQALYKHYKYLFMSLILMILLTPLLQTSPGGKWWLDLTLLAITLLCVFTLQTHPLRFAIAALLGLLSISSSVFDLIAPTTFWDLTRIIVRLAFFMFVSSAIFTAILREKEITAELIIAALCAYILMGYAYADMYQLIEAITPGAFVQTLGSAKAVELMPFEYVYFSFTVMTTVGFGDIAPISMYAKSVVILEEITGIFYMAIFVSRLIAAERRDRRAASDIVK